MSDLLNPRFTLVQTKRFYSIEVTSTERWLTTRLQRAVGSSADIDFACVAARCAIEEDVSKARQSRARFCELDEQRGFRSTADYCAVLGPLLTRESQFSFDPAAHPLRASLVECLGLEGPQELSLEYLHLNQRGADVGKRHEREGKLSLLSGLLDVRRRRNFHLVYDAFVRSQVLPLVTRRYSGPAPVTRIFYQSFPCLRTVRPGEFSIGCHCDITYGFSQGTLNVWLPLTTVSGTNSLVVESASGLEDWHALSGRYGTAWLFHGALSSHFTPANTTASTRFSLDFRVILGPLWEQGHDRFSSEPGYFLEAELLDGLWERVDKGPLPQPDGRMGFPFGQA